MHGELGTLYDDLKNYLEHPNMLIATETTEAE